MRPRPRSAEEAARLLLQRLELGAHEIFLEELTRDEALALAAAARVGASSAGEGADRSRASDSARARRATPSAPASSSTRAGAIPGPAAPRDAGSGRAELPLPTRYDELREAALACTRCGLAEGRTQVVFSDGALDADLMVVGEAPGAQEDATGLPFVGAAGQFLDLLLATVDLSRKDSVYICNVLKCRPPGNRNPQPDEIEACSPFLKRQIELVRPQALLAVGTFAGRLLTGKDRSLGQLRGEVHVYEGVPLVVTYHPAALLRNPGWTRAFWDDLQLLRGVMDAA